MEDLASSGKSPVESSGYAKISDALVGLAVSELPRQVVLPGSNPIRDYSSSGPVERRPGEYATRRLKIFAFDPQEGRRREHRISIEIPYEELRAGPRGRLIEVVDFDANGERYYTEVDLENPKLLASGGLEPNVGDHQFHQQMVYAVASKVISNFERALGRRLSGWGDSTPPKPLTILPHAFAGRNAFFDPESSALCFGYFRADLENPGKNFPGQLIFSCLSQDIIAHETAHAVVHQLRPAFIEPTNPDVLGFHEAIADIVAIFQHFSFAGVLVDQVRATGGDLAKPGPLMKLARQFGQATASGDALRDAHEAGVPDRDLYSRTLAPHDRGSVLVRGVFDAFLSTYEARVGCLLRMGITGGKANLGPRLHPDLCERVAEEAADTAQRVLDLCIRALEYLPPVDVTFSDFLRALVTADTDLNPEDPYDLRANLVDSFLARGIYPRECVSLNQESLLWEVARQPRVKLDSKVMDQLLLVGARSWSLDSPHGAAAEVKSDLKRFAEENAPALGLVADSASHRIEVRGYHAMFRVGSDGELLTEASVQFVQTSKDSAHDLAGLEECGGSTVIFNLDGLPRYIIAKPLPVPDLFTGSQRAAAQRRLETTLDFIAACDERDPFLSWAGHDYQVEDRMKHRFTLASIHQARNRSRTQAG